MKYLTDDNSQVQCGQRMFHHDYLINVSETRSRADDG